MPDSERTQICGVDGRVVEDFLVLLQQRYKASEEAVYFLESQEGVSAINIGITNQRDVLSHFVTLLINPDWPEQKQREQIGNAEEHLRRATIEPYETALALKVVQITDRLEEYRTIAATLRADARFSSAPPYEQFRTRLKAIGLARVRVRAAKGENSWNAAWEDGVKAAISGYGDAEKLLSDLNDWMDRGSSVHESKKAFSYYVKGAAIGLALFLLGLLAASWLR